MPAKGTNFMRIVPEKKPEVNMPPKKKQKATDEEWKPLPADEKHRSDLPGKLSEDFPKRYRDTIDNADNRSFWKFAFHLQEMILLYREGGDHDKGDGFLKALNNMLDLSDHNYEKKDKYGNSIGIGHEDMGTDMVKDDVKCLRDIYCVGASTVKLIEEWIETGTMKRLEDLRKEATPAITERVRYTLNGEDEEEEEEFEVKHDYIPDFLIALGELADLYEKQGDFRATAMRRAIIALEGQIITGVEDIKLFVLGDLNGVGKGTLGMLEEFIENGTIQRLEDLRPEEEATPDQVKWFSSLTKEQAGYIQDWWDETGERKWCVGTGLPYTFEHYEVEEESKKTTKKEEEEPAKRFWKLAETDVRKAVAELPEDIKLTVDGEGHLLLNDRNRDQDIGRGCPFTFEYEGDTYEVDGTVEEIEWEGAIKGLQFDGQLFLKGTCVAGIDLQYEAYDGALNDDEYCNVSFEDEECPAFGQLDFEEAVRDEFGCNVAKHYKLAYRE